MENPYASPTAPARRTRPPRRAAFEVGVAERYLVEIFLSLWDGTEVYTVDDVEVLRLRSMAIRSRRRFEVGETEKHAVDVTVDMLPSWNCLIFPGWIAEVHVDGRLVVAELFPVMRRRLQTLNRIANYILIAAAGLLVLMVLLLVSVWLVLQWVRAGSLL